jgi:hypothetical protein
MHIMINPCLSSIVCIVTFRTDSDQISKFSLAKECTDTLYNISGPHIKGHTINLHLLVVKLRTAWKLLINDFIELLCSSV